jgi:hypothetical protein
MEEKERAGLMLTIVLLRRHCRYLSLNGAKIFCAGGRARLPKVLHCAAAGKATLLSGRAATTTPALCHIVCPNRQKLYIANPGTAYAPSRIAVF